MIDRETQEAMEAQFRDTTPLLALRNESCQMAMAPAPRCSMKVRTARADDLAFIDSLQKMHSHMVGWIARKQIEKNIEDEKVLVAEGEDERQGGGRQLGYVIANDRYSGRDDVGIIFQLNVLPMSQRNLVGAALVKEVFERAAYGCRLFCCWCAQDIRANYFWEALGFLPLAFRTGSRAKQRIHVFWERRVREDDEITPYWFPSQTRAGAVREDRIVLPIPPGTHWLDAKPLVLPGAAPPPPPEPDIPDTLPGGQPVRPRQAVERPQLTMAQKAALKRMQSRHLAGAPLGKKAVLTGSGIKYVDRTDFVPETDTPEELEELLAPKKSKPRKPSAPRQKHDPKYIAAARELRDRYLEHINAEDPGAALPPGMYGKWNVSRAIEDGGRRRGARDGARDDGDGPRVIYLPAA